MPVSPDTSITIIGGGIGGLVLALQLEADGFKNITIFEASRELRAIGSGINLQVRVRFSLPSLPGARVWGSSEKWCSVQVKSFWTV